MSGAESDATEEATSTPSRRFVPKNVVAPLGFAVLLTAIFGFNYMSSGHEPIAKDMPFGVVGSSPLPDDAQGSLFSLDVTEYASETEATQAMDEGRIAMPDCHTGSPVSRR